MSYGLTNQDYIFSQNKLQTQEEYLKNHYIKNLQTNEKTSLYDISMSANHSPRYFAEVLNIVECYRDKNVILGKKGVFITATLDGCYRNALKGDYSRFSLEKINKEIPKDLRNKVFENKPLDNKDLRDILGYQFKKFLDAWRYISPHTSRDYIKVTEPHKKDGVPHLHALLYVDPESNGKIKQVFKHCFPAPQNHKRTQKNLTGDDTNGYQTNIISTSGYILKYILKTFRDVKKGAKLSLINAWYIKHKVRRFTRSQLRLSTTNQRLSVSVLRRLRLHKINGCFKEFKQILSELELNEKAFINYHTDSQKRLYIECRIGGRYIQITPTEHIENNLYTNKQIITKRNYKLFKG